MRKLRDKNHNVYIACPTERRYHEKTSMHVTDGVHILNIWTLNAQKTSLIEKGICTLLLDRQFTSAVKRYYNDVKFDLILYTTPPITFTNTISFLKKRDQATTYLLLKDIFPQNAVDLGLISKNGLIYAYFRKKEKKMYAISDYIGCLSPANVEFLLTHNHSVNPNIVEVNPNTIEPIETGISEERRKGIRQKYKIPQDATVFVYGGNLGKPQGIDFLIEVLESNIQNKEIFFLVVGSGTEFKRLYKWYSDFDESNFLIMEALPKNEYDELMQACDIGLIFLDKRFTIPNFPSRLLSYLEYHMPVLAATDVNTDIGKIITESGCGFWVESGDITGFNDKVKAFIEDKKRLSVMGEKGFTLLQKEYTVEVSYNTLMNRIKE